jgi:AraC-like DNA-binding protein
MTERPTSLPARPNPAADDPLSDLFRAVRFTRALYYTIDTAGPWPAIHVPPGVAIASGLGPRTQQVLSYHLLVEGVCWTGLEDGEPVRLERGDAIVYPRGDPYFMAPELGPRPGSADAPGLMRLLEGISSGMVPPRLAFNPQHPDRTRFVCGFLGCDPRPFDPLLRALPRMLYLKGMTGRLKHLLELALSELEGAGEAPVRERLSESMFIETVRQHLASLEPDRAGWLSGLRDPVVGRALALLHGGLAQPWTLASLAKQAGASRSALADRFAKLVGQPPMQYLTGWRMRTAAHLLTEGAAKVAEVASEVGYDSEAAFSRAFKKATGAAPAAWRDGRANGAPDS